MLKGCTCDTKGGGKNRSEEKGAEKVVKPERGKTRKRGEFDGDHGKYQKVQLHAK